jgi:sn-glycerol 3-phosphate transport system permease protein
MSNQKGLTMCEKQERKLAFLFILPAFAVFLLFMFYPLAYTLYLSLFKWNMVSPNMKFVAADNYIRLLTDPVSLKIAENTLLYIVILVLLNFLVPYVLAFINTFQMRRGKHVYKALLFSSSLIALVVGAILFQWIFNPVSGPVGGLAEAAGFSLPAWSKTPGLVILVISLVAVYKAFGYNFLILLSGMNGVPEELIEAARLEKTPSRKIFTQIVVPLTSSTAVYILIMTIVQGLQYVFTPIKVLTQGGPNDASSNIIYQGYEYAFSFYETGMSAALAIVTMLIFLVLLYLEFKYVEKGVYYEN